LHGEQTFGATMQDAILKLFGRLPKGGEGASRLQTLLFSATLHSPEIRELATKICQNPVFIDLKVSEAPHQPPESRQSSSCFAPSAPRLAWHAQGQTT
jgi:superfamily II DNA/RNA helicase